jgi:hypothetical protein
VPDAQQPVGQDTPSQTQVPFRQRWPPTQAAPAPQLQTPAEEQLSVSRTSQATHVAPGAPHAELEDGVHVRPAQQPSGHDVASQVHAPLAQCWPGAQVAPLPHLHCPALQLSASIALHGKHDAPPVPHVAVEGALHVPSVQHPLAQEVASHTQRPPTQRCPPAHSGLPSQVHLPAAEHPSAVAVHWTQATPPIPHDMIVDGVQVIPLQQPSAHAQPEQAPELQVFPSGHAEHASPALPHALGTLPG